MSKLVSELLVRCEHGLKAHHNPPDGMRRGYCDGARPVAVAEVVAWLREQQAGEVVEANEKWFGVAKHPIPYMKPGRYLVVLLDPKEGT